MEESIYFVKDLLSKQSTDYKKHLILPFSAFIYSIWRIDKEEMNVTIDRISKYLVRWCKGFEEYSNGTILGKNIYFEQMDLFFELGKLTGTDEHEKKMDEFFGSSISDTTRYDCYGYYMTLFEFVSKMGNQNFD